MKGIRKFGNKYDLIAEAVKTRDINSVRKRIDYLIKQMKTNKHHPDRDIIRSFVRKRLRAKSNMWTRKQTEMLIKAITKYGKDYEKISNGFKNFTQEQVRKKVEYMHRQTTSNLKHENAKSAKILKKLPRRANHMWTDKEKKKFNAALQKYGYSCTKIVKCFPTMAYRQIEHHAVGLKNAILRDKNHPDAHLKKLLEGGSPNFYWSQKENDMFIKLLKKHGKNYPLIAAKLKTKTL